MHLGHGLQLRSDLLRAAYGFERRPCGHVPQGAWDRVHDFERVQRVTLRQHADLHRGPLRLRHGGRQPQRPSLPFHPRLLQRRVRIGRVCDRSRRGPLQVRQRLRERMQERGVPVPSSRVAFGPRQGVLLRLLVRRRGVPGNAGESVHESRCGLLWR